MRFNNISLQSLSFTDNTPIEEPVTDPRLKYKRFSVWQNNENFQIPQNSEMDHSRDGILYSGSNPLKESKSAKSLPRKVIVKLTGSFFQSLLTIFSCIIYVISTYTSNPAGFMNNVEYVIAGLFGLDYL